MSDHENLNPLPTEAELSGAAARLDSISDAMEIVARRVAEAVVAIRIERPGPTSAPGYDTRGTVGSVGSGVIVSESGQIATAAHVIDRAERILVTMADGSEHVGNVVGRDDSNDLAVIEIDATGLKAIELSGGQVAPGRFVLAAGRPPRSGFVVANGIVSSVGRRTRNFAGTLLSELIQTTAVVEPGVSGGALTDGHGALIGIVTSTTDSTRAISFAVPVARVVEVVGSVLSAGRSIGVPGSGS